MTAQQAFGKCTVLSPPLEFGGDEYAIACQFSNNPEGNTSPVIVDAVVESVSGTTTKTIVCQRSKVTSSYTEDGREILYDCLVGGNVCSTIEPERIYSPFNTSLIRGDDSHRRSIVGDAVWWGDRAFLRTGGGAYQHAPASISWQGEDVAPVTYLQQIEINDVYMRPITEQELLDNPGATIHIPDGSILDQFVGVHVRNSQAQYIPIARKIFGSDASLYPHDAEFDVDAPQYWVNPSDGTIRLSSRCGGVGNTVRVRTCLKGLSDYTQGTQGNVRTFLQGTGEGYGILGGTEDSIYLHSCLVSGQSAYLLTLQRYMDGDVATFGTGSYEIRDGYDADAAMVAVTWDASGITGVYSRATKGAAMTSHSFSPIAFGSATTIPLTITRSGTQVRVHANYSTQVGPNIDLGIDPQKDMRLSVGTTTKCYVRWLMTNRDLFEFPLSPGSTSLVYEQFYSDVQWRKTVDLAYGTPLIEIRNELYGNLLSYNPNDPARNRFDSDYETYITLPSEASGDTLRIIQESPESSNPTPGRAPRTFGIVDFADGGTNVNDNKAHWHDTLVIADPHEEFNAIPGDTIVIRRNAIFDPSDPPALYYNAYNSGSSPWVLIDPAYYLIREVEGIVLLKQGFVDVTSIDPATTKLCIRAYGTMFSQSGEMQSRQVNDMVAAIEAFDQAWLPASLDGGFLALGGYSTIYSVGPESFSFDGCDVKIDNLILGNERASLAYWGQILHDHGATLPANYTGNDIWIGDDLSDEHDDVLSVWYPAPSPCTSGYTLGPTFVAKQVGEINLGGRPGALTNFAGAAFDSVSGLVYQVDYNAIGIGITPNGPLSRIPDGSTILEARLECYFDGLSYQSWTSYKKYPYSAIWGTTVGPGGYAIETLTTVNGATVREYAKTAGDVVLVDSYTAPIANPTSGNVGFKLIAKRKNSARVQTVFGDYQNATRDIHTGIGSGISLSLAQSGKWSVIDVTASIQDLLDDRHSEASEYFLFPTTGTSTGLGIDAYLQALQPQQSLSTSYVTSPAKAYLVEHEASGQYMTYNTLTLGSLVIRYRLPSGFETKLVIPKLMPAII